MAKMKWYRFTFADGFVCEARGFSKVELDHKKRDHGDLISKVLVSCG